MAPRPLREQCGAEIPVAFSGAISLFTALVTPGHGIDMDYSSARRHNRRSGD